MFRQHIQIKIGHTSTIQNLRHYILTVHDFYILESVMFWCKNRTEVVLTVRALIIVIEEQNSEELYKYKQNVEMRKTIQ